MKNGMVIDLKGKDAQFKLKHKRIENVIVYNDENFDEKYILLKDVNSIKIEILESNILLTIIIIVGSIAALAFLVFVIAFASIGFKMH